MDNVPIANVFKNFDHRGDGLYSREELSRLLRTLDTQSQLTSTIISGMLEALDADRKGWIHYEAFCNWVFCPKGTPRAVVEAFKESTIDSASAPKPEDAAEQVNHLETAQEGSTQKITQPSAATEQSLECNVTEKLASTDSIEQEAPRSNTSSKTVTLPGDEAQDASAASPSESARPPVLPSSVFTQLAESEARTIVPPARQRPTSASPRRQPAPDSSPMLYTSDTSTSPSASASGTPLHLPGFKHSTSTPTAGADLRAVLEQAAGMSNSEKVSDGEATWKAIESEKGDNFENSFGRTTSAASSLYYKDTQDIMIVSKSEKDNEQDPFQQWATSPPVWGVYSPGSERVMPLVSCSKDANGKSYMEDGQKILDPCPMPQTADGDHWALYCVYDGHGGRDVVDYCESTLHDIIMVELRRCCANRDCVAQDVHKAVEASFRKADSQLSMMGSWKSGSTVTVALFHRCQHDLTIHVGNIGDSRALLLGHECSTRLTSEHRMSNKNEVDRISREGGHIRHGRVGGILAVTRSLGDHHVKSCGVSCIPEVTSSHLGSKSGAIIIATDGIWDVLDDVAASQVVSDCVDKAMEENNDPKRIAAYLENNAAHQLVEAAKAKGSSDNILVQVFFF